MPTFAPIKCGLFQFNIVDYHAILGLPIGASADQVRKRYLKITRLLFPDIRALETQEENELADQLLSKLVNPAYENLFKDKSARSEHLLILEQIGARVAQEKKLRLKSKKSQELAAAKNIEATYNKYINALFQQEYSPINKTLEKIALMSEFNLVYLQAKSGKVAEDKVTVSQTQKTTSEEPKQVEAHLPEPAEEPASVVDPTAKWVEPYLRRGKQFIDKREYNRGIAELREALKLDAQNSQAHTLLGLAYVKQSQLGMAKIHINKALQLDPKNEMAREGKQVLQKLLEQGKGTNSSGQGSTEKKANSSRGGLLGGLFGKKKK